LGAVSSVKDRSIILNPQNILNSICASIYSTVTSEALESYFAIKFGFLSQLSDQQIMDCSSNLTVMNTLYDKPNPNFGCSGGNLYNSFNYAIEYEISLEKYYKYLGKDEQCKIG
jgi:hypothetical protein